MSRERDNWRRDPIEDEAHRINRMLANDCLEQATQALREDARDLRDPRVFHYLVERVADLNSRQYRGDHLVQGRRGGLYIEDQSGCLYGTGLDAYGRRVRQPERFCPSEPAWRSDRGIFDRTCDPRIDPGIHPRSPRFDIRIDPGINRSFDPRFDSRPHSRPEFRIMLPDVRGLTRNLPDPRDILRDLPRPGHGLPDRGDFMTTLPVPGWQPNPRDYVDALPRPRNQMPDNRDIRRRLPEPVREIRELPGTGNPLPRIDRLPNPRDLMDRLPIMSDEIRHLPKPVRPPSDGRQHILVDPISRLPLPERR
ncbi:MAG: hypothetical protein IT342_07490 [Candidatus Melainabacteria bacterium]|nr:hypothetical protein [Candidatus Melainabacteria bacterium]